MKRKWLMNSSKTFFRMIFMGGYMGFYAKINILENIYIKIL